MSEFNFPSPADLRREKVPLHWLDFELPSYGMLSCRVIIKQFDNCKNVVHF